MCLDAILVSTIFGGICLIMSVFFYNIRRSRCLFIKTPCCTCTRENLSAEELEHDKLEIPHI